jgi:RNA polymerase sigma factor (sigma-70 family)
MDSCIDKCSGPVESDREVSSRLSDWFRQWRSPLRQFLKARSALPEGDLDDVSQEVFLRLLRYKRTEAIEYPQAYLYRMASNVAAEWGTRARMSRPHDSAWLADLLATDQPEENAVAAEIQDEVKRAIQLLKPLQRQILKLHYAHGLGHAEIAERLGTTKRSVKRVLIKSYGSLREELDPSLLGHVGDA